MNYYDENAEKYYNKTINAINTDNLDKFLESVPKDGVIVDLGCGSGRDTLYMKSLGYTDILPIDSSKGLINKAYEEKGLRILEADILTYRYALNYYSGIFANASLVHITKDEFIHLLPRLYRGLKYGGSMYISLKPIENGVVEEVIDGRYFRYYDEKSLRNLFYSLDIRHFEMWRTPSTIDSSKEWINILIKKGV